MLQRLSRKKKAQSCLAVPRPRGIWRAAWKSLLPNRRVLGNGRGLCCCCQKEEDLEQQADLQKSGETRKQVEHQTLGRMVGLRKLMVSPNSI